jgi:hypothetical protein
MLIKLFILFGEVTSNNLVLHPRKKKSSTVHSSTFFACVAGPMEGKPPDLRCLAYSRPCDYVLTYTSSIYLSSNYY